MRVEKTLREIEERNITEELARKRFACAQCGNTWVELIGLVLGHKDGKEDLCLRIGLESENCQACRFRTRECQECGSQNVYEIMFSRDASEEVPLSFKSIRRVSRS